MTIKDLRTASGMTQKAFAEYFGIPKRTVENWEGGQRECPSYLLSLIAYKLEKEGLIRAADTPDSANET
jgi:DNA-binding transcriptional regulator YiaG